MARKREHINREVKIGRRPISDPGELKLALLEGDRPKTLELVRDKKPMTVQLVVSRPVAPRARAPVEALRLELQTMRAEFLERLAAIEAEIEKLRVDEERAN